MIVVQCHCGKRFKVPTELAGRAGRCTACGWRVVVPLAPGTPEAEAALQEVFSASAEQLNALIDKKSGEPKAVVQPDPLPRAEALVDRTIGGLIVGRRLGSEISGVFQAAPEGEPDRPLAVKVLPKERIDRNPATAKRFVREARALVGTSHPNLVSIHDVGEEGGSYFLTMEFHPGMNLEERQRRSPNGKLEESYVLPILADAARALDHLHRMRLVHRAVRPKHILTEPTKLCGFGLVRTAGAGAVEEAPGVDAEVDVTTKGQIVGKPEFMSPEQIRDLELDGRSDLFSLGVTAYAVLSGEAPFTGKTPLRVVRQILQHEPPPLRQVAPEVSEATSRVVGRLLAKDPNERYASAKELLADLEAPPEKRGRPRRRLLRGRRQTPVVLMAVIGLLVAISLIIGIIVMQSSG